MDTAWRLTATEWAAVAALGTAATALIALVTAWLVLGQLRAARRQLTDARSAQGEQERPYVIVFIDTSEASPQLMDLVVENVGKTPARNVRIHLDPPPARAEETVGLELSKARLFNEPLPLLPPGRMIRVFFDSAIDRKGAVDLPTEHRVRVTYGDSAGEWWDEKSVLDLDILKGAMFTEIFGVHHLAKAVREMNVHLKNASILGQRGHVETDTAVETRRDRKERVSADRQRRQQAHEELVAQLSPHEASEESKKES